MKKTKRSISKSEFFMIALFLAHHKEAFAFHCDGYSCYYDEDIDNLIEEVAGPEYKDLVHKL